MCVFQLQFVVTFGVSRVNMNARHGAHFDALWRVKVADTLGALGRRDFINDLTLINGLIRAFCFAHITIDAFVGDNKRHRG